MEPRNLLPNDPDTVLNPPQDTSVPRAYTCADHAQIMASMGRVQALLEAHEKRGDRIEHMLQEIVAGDSAQNIDIALLKQQARVAAGVVAALVTLACNALWAMLSGAFGARQ